MVMMSYTGMGCTDMLPPGDEFGSLPSPETIRAELAARGVVAVTMTMDGWGHRRGDLVVCSHRIAEGFEIYGAARRLP